MKKYFKLVRYFASSLLTVIGIVLVWRGIWNLDKDLKEIEGPLDGTNARKS